MKKDVPLVSDHRLLEIIRSVTRADVKWWELDDKAVSRPDMNGEDNLLKLARLVADEAKARIPLWRLEQQNEYAGLEVENEH